MSARRWAVVGVFATALFVGLLVTSGTVTVPLGGDGYDEDVETGETNERSERANVTVFGDDGSEKATVDAEVALTRSEKETGLSEHESLAPGDGMLFPYDGEDDRTFIMPNMDFPIDIVFVGADGEITSIEHARAPEPGEDGSELRYPGTGKWILEVPRGYANETGLEPGDEVRIAYR